AGVLLAVGTAALSAGGVLVRGGACHQAPGAALRPGVGSLLFGGHRAGGKPLPRLWALLRRRGGGAGGASGDRNPVLRVQGSDPVAAGKVCGYNVGVSVRLHQRIQLAYGAGRQLETPDG